MADLIQIYLLRLRAVASKARLVTLAGVPRVSARHDHI